MSALCGFLFFSGHIMWPVFIQNNLSFFRGGIIRMNLTLIKNPDESKSVLYKIARIVYAETHAVSLRSVESLTSMIANNARVYGREYSDIVSDNDLFEVLNPESKNHKLLSVNVSDEKFQMCLRVVTRMLHGALDDCCNGATRFHHADEIPQWATSRGYIADIDGILFYL